MSTSYSNIVELMHNFMLQETSEYPLRFYNLRINSGLRYVGVTMFPPFSSSA